jgi:hypothetical protein
MFRSAVLALLIVSTPAAADIHVAPAKPVSAVLLKKIKTMIAKRMVDPESVVISDARVVDVQLGDKPLQLVCGKYNAKNRMGGYAGSDDFIYETSYLKGVLSINLGQREIAFFSDGDRPDFDGSPEGIREAVRMGLSDQVQQQSSTYIQFAQTLYPFCLGQSS